jgi:hypothetical protein
VRPRVLCGICRAHVRPNQLESHISDHQRDFLGLVAIQVGADPKDSTSIGLPTNGFKCRTMPKIEIIGSLPNDLQGNRLRMLISYLTGNTAAFLAPGAFE